MKHRLLFAILFPLLTTSLSAQEMSEPLISLLGEPMESNEIQAWLGAKDECEVEDVSANEVMMYTCPKKGIQIEAESGMLTWIMVFREGTEYENIKWDGYKGDLPYGLKLSMTREEVEGILGKPEKLEGFSESYTNGKNALYPDQNITVYYDIPSDKTRPEDKILGIVID